MKNKIKNFKEIGKICQKLKKENKKIVFAHGVFDILHKGHVYFLSEAKKLGDVLIVGVDHDENVKILKGSNRPINDHKSRLYVLSHLETVDFLFLIPSFKKIKSIDSFFTQLYKEINPNIVASSLKAGKFGLYKKKKAEKLGIKFVDLSKKIYSKNTSKVINILGIN